MKKGEISAQQIANHFKVEMWEILIDLRHIAKSIKPVYEMKISPSECRSCGFLFKERSKIKKPTKCPKCKDERIQPPLFKIVKREF